MIKDFGCPTCGSKNFGTISMEKTSNWKKQCYNCKKIWISESPN